MPERAMWAVIDAEHMDIAQKGVSDWSDAVTVTVVGDTLAPAIPTLAATAADQAIDLTLAKPTTNADGTACVDFKEFKVYYDNNGSIDITVPASYDGTFTTSSLQHTWPTAAKTYFVATSIDYSGNESTACAEVNATPTAAGGAPAPVYDDYVDNFNHDPYIGNGAIGLVYKTPKTSWVRWAAWNLYFDTDNGGGFTAVWTLLDSSCKRGYVHKNLTTTFKYKYQLRVMAEDGSESAGTTKDGVAGAGYQPNAANNDTIIAVTFVAENIVALNEVTGPRISAETKISINDRTYGNQGIQLDYNAGTPRLYCGDGANQYVQFDGTKIQWKAANSELDAAGNLTVSSATVSGALTAGAGSGIAVSYLTAGTIASKSIVMAVTPAAGDVEIRAVIATGDFANAGAASGFIIGIDDSDGDKAKFYFGSPTSYMAWDGSTALLGGTGASLRFDASNKVYYGVDSIYLIGSTAAFILSNGGVWIEPDFDEGGAPYVVAKGPFSISSDPAAALAGGHYDTMLDVSGAITFRELAADPADPDEGAAVMWMSDGTGSGDDGDIYLKIKAGGTVKTTKWVDFSAL